MRPKKRNSSYIPGLDGWRAIAIFFVLLAHDNEHSFGILNTHRIHEFGWAGVNLFFAISGLLICSRLLEEERLKGSISLHGFYVRRIFRILPPAWLFLIAVVILESTHFIVKSGNAVPAAFLMVTNFYLSIHHAPPEALFTAHFWSLSVEEHFYLLLPAVLIFFPRGELSWSGPWRAFPSRGSCFGVHA
jgi:peptidoglycan/LPS O-acetylase OafA/YrhL